MGIVWEHVRSAHSRAPPQTCRGLVGTGKWEGPWPGYGVAAREVRGEHGEPHIGFLSAHRSALAVGGQSQLASLPRRSPSSLLVVRFTAV